MFLEIKRDIKEVTASTTNIFNNSPSNLLELNTKLDGSAFKMPIAIHVDSSNKNNFFFQTINKDQIGVAVPLLCSIDNIRAYFKSQEKLKKTLGKEVVYGYSLAETFALCTNARLEQPDLKVSVQELNDVYITMRMSLNGTTLGTALSRIRDSVGLGAVSLFFPVPHNLSFGSDQFFINKQDYLVNNYKTLIY